MGFNIPKFDQRLYVIPVKYPNKVCVVAGAWQADYKIYVAEWREYNQYITGKQQERGLTSPSTYQILLQLYN